MKQLLIISLTYFLVIHLLMGGNDAWFLRGVCKSKRWRGCVKTLRGRRDVPINVYVNYVDGNYTEWGSHTSERRKN